MHLQRADASYLLRLVTKVEDGGFWTMHRMGVDPPTDKTAVVLTPKAQGFIAQGAYRSACPFCPGGQFSDPTLDRFMCCDCANVKVGTKWVGVEWPAEVAEIEAVLLTRTSPATMNWLPGETVDDLYAENVEHEVITIVEVPASHRKAVQAVIDAAHDLKPKAHKIAPGTVVHDKSEMKAGKR